MDKNDLVSGEELEGWSVDIHNDNVWVEHDCGFVLNAKADKTLLNLVALATGDGQHNCKDAWKR